MIETTRVLHIQSKRLFIDIRARCIQRSSFSNVVFIFLHYFDLWMDCCTAELSSSSTYKYELLFFYYYFFIIIFFILTCNFMDTFVFFMFLYICNFSCVNANCIHLGMYFIVMLLFHPHLPLINLFYTFGQKCSH